MKDKKKKSKKDEISFQDLIEKERANLGHNQVCWNIISQYVENRKEFNCEIMNYLTVNLTLTFLLLLRNTCRSTIRKYFIT